MEEGGHQDTEDSSKNPLKGEDVVPSWELPVGPGLRAGPGTSPTGTRDGFPQFCRWTSPTWSSWERLLSCQPFFPTPVVLKLPRWTESPFF